MRETCKTVHLKRLLEQAYKSFPPLAQLVEQWTVVPFVTCSIQVERRRVPYIDSTIVNFFPIAQLVERATVNRKVIGSNPVGKVLLLLQCVFHFVKYNIDLI
jgi:hypothetical protein